MQTLDPRRLRSLPDRRVRARRRSRRRPGSRRPGPGGSRCRSTAALTFGGRRVFGENKTLRGFVVMVPAAALALCAARRSSPAARTARAGLWPLTPRATRCLARGPASASWPASCRTRSSSGSSASRPARRPGRRRACGLAVRRRSPRFRHRHAPRRQRRGADAVADVGHGARRRAGDSLGVQRPDVPSRPEAEARVTP